MTQNERLLQMIDYLLIENSAIRNMIISDNEAEQFNLFRSLVNIRPPKPASKEFLTLQDEYLKEKIANKGITDIGGLTPIKSNIYLWQGDITTLKCSAIVNAANSGMTGCYSPCHGCIDNAIHTYAGVQLRLECSEIMKQQGYAEPTGNAKITKAYNLPCDYVIHTVGPIVSNSVTEADKKMLASCYRSCLEVAEKNGVKSIAFCCISTGEFHFPNDKAAEIAVQTVKDYMEQSNSDMKVIFNVFKDFDYQIYRNLLGTNGKTEE